MWGKGTLGERATHLRSRQGRVTPAALALVVAAAAVLLLGFATISGAAPGTDADVTVYDQCSNDKPPSTATDCPGGWINGILNSNNSHYAEDDVTPQRVVLDLPKQRPADRPYGRDQLPDPQERSSRLRLPRNLEPHPDLG